MFLGRDINSEPNYSDTIALEIDKEMRRIVDQSYTSTRELLLKHRDQLDLLAQALLQTETIDKSTIDSLMETGLLPDGTRVDLNVNINKADDTIKLETTVADDEESES